MADINVKNIDDKVKVKASFFVKTKGKTLSQAIREQLIRYAREYDKMKKGE